MVFEIRLPFLNPKTFEQQKMICLNCENPISTRITQQYTTELCLGNEKSTHPPCGCLLWFPSRIDRPYGIRKFISRETYIKNKEKDQEREKFIREMRAKGITVNHVANGSKVHRMLTHEHPLESGERAVEEKKHFEDKVKSEMEKIEGGLKYAKK